MKIKLILLFVWLTQLAYADTPMLPVFFLKYGAAFGTEETEDEEIEPASNRQYISLRVKEEWSEDLTSNLYFKFQRKEYLQSSGSYTYFYFYPDLTYNFSDYLQWQNGFQTRWMWYDETDANGLPKDYVRFKYTTKLTIEPIKELKIFPSFLAIYDLYENQEKSAQSYSVGLSLQARLTNYLLSAAYKYEMLLPLGDESQVDIRFINEFSISLTWDPNK